MPPGPASPGPGAAPGWTRGRGPGRRLRLSGGVGSGGARAGFASPGGAGLGSGQLHRAGFGGPGVAGSVRGQLVRFRSGACGSPWTWLGLETLGVRAGSVQGSGTIPKRLHPVGPECPGTPRLVRGSGSAGGIVGGRASAFRGLDPGTLGLLVPLWPKGVESGDWAARLVGIRDQGTFGGPAPSDLVSPAFPSNGSSEEGISEAQH